MSEKDFRPELFVVVGPNGNGKSSAIYETKIADEIIFVNPFMLPMMPLCGTTP